MAFDSLSFAVLVFLSMMIYYVPFLRRYQVLTLIIASCVFYGLNSPKLLLLLLVVISFNAYVSYNTYFCSEKRRFFWITFGVTLNLLFLAFFKYRLQIFTGLFSGFNTPSALGSLLLILPLPMGISFYIFESISFLVDVFQSKNHNINPPITVEKRFPKHWISTAFFVLFFPKLISGPIIKAKNFWPQVSSKSFKAIPWNDVIRFLILGYFFKMVIANNLAQTTFWIADPYFKEFSSATLLTLLFGYSIQIFTDFAGYSLIAIAIALMFGYRLPVNFNFPYISKSVTEFWKRWHISLSDWLKEYLYFPLGGSRRGKARTYINLIIVMVLGGLWHGGTWGFAVWGLWHGLALAFERFIKHLRGCITQKNMVIAQNRFIIHLLDLLKILAVFSFVSIGWLVFKLPDFTDVLQFIDSIFNNTHIGGIEKPILFSVAIYSMPVFLYYISHLVLKSWNVNLLKYEGILYGTLLFLIVVNGGDSNTFIYFQF